MHKTCSPLRHSLPLAALLVTSMATGCADSASPAGPSAIAGVGQFADLASTGRPGPAELQDRGWTCLEPPIPDPPTVCSPPNQGFPAVPPPDDRPATFTFWIFREGRFVGTELLIRSDLYRGQLCESTGEEYFLAELIGYYECVHTPGR